MLCISSSKVIFVLSSRYLNSCIDFVCHAENDLIRKMRSKFMTTQPGKQTIAIHY